MRKIFKALRKPPAKGSFAALRCHERRLRLSSVYMPPECVQQLVRIVLSPSSLMTLGVYVPSSSVSPLNYIETISDNLTSMLFMSYAAPPEHLP